MIQLNKEQREPVAWTEKKATPGFTQYESIPELREALLIEQGYICAYCMRRIPATDPNVDATSKIEHIKSQEDRDDLQLIYSNMAICCPGNLNDEPHCDKLKGGSSISFDLYTPVLEQSISYSSKDGTIRSSNSTWNNEMKDLLNLNQRMLMQNRLSTLNGVIQALTSKGWNTASISTQLRQWRSFDSDGKRKPFCGIIIWYLKKTLTNP